tara:strand:- start:6215 stop:7402 length:1188 start_codon:yes stop_codon:yes gene_type:complete
MQGEVGDRLATYATQLPPRAIEAFLGHDPRSRTWKKLPGDIEAIYSHMQRATSPQRTKAIIDYILSRCAPGSAVLGAFPAVSIAVQQPVGFRPIEGVPGVGNLEIDLSARNARIVTDGLGRLSGILELLDLTYDANIPQADKDQFEEVLSHLSIPVVIYAPHPSNNIPLTREEMGQLFFDFNFKAVPVPPRIAISLDRSDAYIQATNRLAKESRAIVTHGGMEIRAASLGTKSTAIVVQQVLLKFVRGASEGGSFQESNKSAVDEPNLTLRNLKDRVEMMAEFIDTFAEAMGEKFGTDRKSLHLSSPGWQTLGVIFHDLVFDLKSPEPMKTAKALGQLDWSRSSALWADLMVEKEVPGAPDELVLRSAGSSTKREMVKRVREAIGVKDRLAEMLS